MDVVAPLVGAWIEIVKYMLIAVVKESLLSWERGLKSIIVGVAGGILGRSSRGSVD